MKPMTEVQRNLTRNRIEATAAICHDANRRFCLALGDTSQPLWEDAPDWQRSSAVLGVKSIENGTINSPGKSHKSWLEQKRDEGWVWGEVKDTEKKTHPCMVEFEDLPMEQQIKDHLFLAIASAILDNT